MIINSYFYGLHYTLRLLGWDCWVSFKHSKVRLVGWKNESKENGKERTEDGLIRKVERS